MTALTLSKSEVAQLTRSPQKARQVAFLVRNGIRHYIDAYGWPVVMRSTVEGRDAPSRPEKPKWSPGLI
ncbi:DUF4224 domain-containing protein [Lysobacter sp. MMG2]|uniref:DUF4224 domain-containing protein n=1 Tax=Lysobacter sp. MMG2 TaxID=2801338 RepID=UPI001C23C344|nr:DUF4224 domain-containing protein [Lysobacter sp. MMG2]MBU8978180.1 DUF4224 domain-containing protein [Lysobacter sp. MMG2]